MNLMITGGAGFIGTNLVLYWLSSHPDDLVVNFDTLTYAAKPHNIEEVKDLSNWDNNITSGEYSDYYLFQYG